VFPYNMCVRMSLWAYSPCSPWVSIHSSTANCSPAPLSASYRLGDGVKIAVDSVDNLLDVAGSRRCEIARCRAADDGREPVINTDVKDGSARAWSGERIERVMIFRWGPRRVCVMGQPLSSLCYILSL
jgi:hypothetical protein